MSNKHPCEELYQLNDNFFRAFMSSPAAMAITRLADGKFLNINRMYTLIMGYPPEEILGLTAEDVGIYVRIDERNLLIRQLQEKGFVHNYDLRVKNRSGDEKNLLISMEPTVYDSEDAIISSFTDMTEYRRAEKALSESEAQRKKTHELLSNLARMVPGVIYQYRLYPDGRSEFPYASPGMNDIYEVSPEAVQKDATPVYGRLHPEDYDRVVAAIQESARTLQMFYCEFRVILPRQGLCWRWSQASPEQLPDGSILWHGIILDITEVKRMGEQLRQTQKMEAIGALAGGIAHDFNNILFPIVGFAEMLLDDVPEDSDIKSSLNQIYNSALRARELVQQILAFSRQEKMALAMMKMQPIIKEVLKLIRSSIPTTISISQSIQPGCGPVKADPTQIHQIVMNLATNAFHAMAENGGTLKVSLEEIEMDNHSLKPDMAQGRYACLTVSDTGTGMTPEVMSRIFDPFFTTKEKGKGTGMGLSVVNKIVKSMNGDIQVHSEPGMGTQFHVYLPVVKGIYEKKEILIKESLPGGSERILLVDDETAIITMEKQILERLGYHVISCVGSMEALEVFRAGSEQYDLVITDMFMPKMSGDKLAIELLKIRPDIPILLCTGFSEAMTNDKINSLGIRGLLMKPIMTKTLAKKVREILESTIR